MRQAVDQLVDGLTRLRIDLAYDGTEFNGWAKQPKLRTVQAEVVSVLTKIFGPSDTDFGLRVAGRTDAGVHAEHQVVQSWAVKAFRPKHGSSDEDEFTFRP